MFQTTNQMWNQSRFGMFCITSVPRMEVSLTLLLGCLRQDRELMRWPCHVSDMGHMGFLFPQTFISIFWLHPTNFTIHFNVGSYGDVGVLQPDFIW